MTLLLDTNAFLWFVLDEPNLGKRAREVILGKYALPEPFEPFVERQLSVNHFALLPIEPKHLAILTTLPFHHRDPFDRLLVAQAMVEDIPLFSNDAALEAYPIERIW